MFEMSEVVLYACEQTQNKKEIKGSNRLTLTLNGLTRY